jgi:hypothetical protein
MIRSGPWKLWVYGDDENLPPALFNLEDDPDEKNDLTCDPQYDDIRNKLLEKVYDGWNPEEVIEKSKLQWDYFDLLTKWGKAVDPDAPYAMVYPSDEYESDVELL